MLLLQPAPGCFTHAVTCQCSPATYRTVQAYYQRSNQPIHVQINGDSWPCCTRCCMLRTTASVAKTADTISVICEANSGSPNEPCIRWGPESPNGKGQRPTPLGHWTSDANISTQPKLLAAVTLSVATDLWHNDLRPEFIPCRRHIGPHVDASCFWDVPIHSRHPRSL